MLIVGQISSKEEAKEITFIAKSFIVGQRFRHLGKEACQRGLSENFSKESWNE